MVRVASVLCVAIVFQAVCGYPRRNYARLDEVKPDLDDVRLTRSAEESPHSGTHAEGTKTSGTGKAEGNATTEFPGLLAQFNVKLPESTKREIFNQADNIGNTGEFLFDLLKEKNGLKSLLDLFQDPVATKQLFPGK